jgi:hypothetical protein
VSRCVQWDDDCSSPKQLAPGRPHWRLSRRVQGEEHPGVSDQEESLPPLRSVCESKTARALARALRPAIVSLIASQVYSGMLAEDELHEKIEEGAFDNRARVYQDGLQVSPRPSEASGAVSALRLFMARTRCFAVLNCFICRDISDPAQSSDGAEDTTLVVRLVAKPRTWGKKRTQPWEAIGKHVHPPPLTTKPPVLLIFRARSKVRRVGPSRVESEWRGGQGGEREWLWR